MLKSIWTWWRTPMVPRSELISLRCEYVDLMMDRDEVLLDRDAALLERDKVIGKFEYVEKRNKELESMLADRNSYVRFLEDSLRQY